MDKCVFTKIWELIEIFRRMSLLRQVVIRSLSWVVR